MNNRQAAVAAASEDKVFVLFVFSYMVEDFVPLQKFSTLAEARTLADKLNATVSAPNNLYKFYGVGQTKAEIEKILKDLKASP